MLKILNKREKVILGLTGGVIAFSVIFNFFIAPILSRNEELGGEIRVARARLKKSLLLLKDKDYIKNRYAKFSTVDNISGRTWDTSVGVLSELAHLANGADIRIIETRPEASKKTGFYKEVLIDLRAEGTVENYLKFIYAVEHSPYLLQIKKLQLTAKPNIQALDGSFSISQFLILE